MNRSIIRPFQAYRNSSGYFRAFLNDLWAISERSLLRFWAIAERWPDKLNSTTPLVAAAEAGEFGDVIVMELPDTDDEGNEVTPLPDPWPDTPAEEQVNALFLPLVTQ